MMSENVLTKSMAIRLIISRRGGAVEERAFNDGIVTVGSDPAATVCLSDSSVAPEHAIVINDDGQLLLINRADGTRLNGEPLPREARRTLSGGDALEVGPYTILLAPGGESASAGVASESQEPAAEERATATAPLRDEAQPPEPLADARQPARSFASILDSLRTEEDSFYFLVETARERRRVTLEGTEMVLGWDETGRRISCEAARVVAARAVVRKDWSGVVVLALSPGMLFVNAETVEAPRRLRNGDRLTMLPASASAPAAPEENYLVFHEPASLVVLDTLLPQQLPPPISPAVEAPAPADVGSGLAPIAPAALAKKSRGLFAPDQRYFGFFTPTEVLVMVCGTLVAAVIIFLILEYS